MSFESTSESSERPRDLASLCHRKDNRRWPVRGRRLLVYGTVSLIWSGLMGGAGCSETVQHSVEPRSTARKDIAAGDKQPTSDRGNGASWRALLANTDKHRAEILRAHMGELGATDRRYAERFLSKTGLKLSPAQPPGFTVGADNSMRPLVLGCFAEEGATVLVVEVRTIARGVQVIVAGKMEGVVVLRSNWSVIADEAGHISIYPGYGTVSEVWLTEREALAFEAGVQSLMRQAQGSEFGVNEEYTKNVHAGFQMCGFLGCWGGYVLDAIIVGIQPDECEEMYEQVFPDWSEERIPAECRHPLWELRYHVWQSWDNALSQRIEAMHPALKEQTRSPGPE